MKFVKTFARNSSSSGRLGAIDLQYFKLKGTSWKMYLDDFFDAFDSWHDKRRIKLRWSDDDIKFERRLEGICVRIILLIFYLSESFLV